ncbi:hypothetical protein FBR4_2195 [Lactiplantibacillus plantarum]|nr:hypothetical protein FBR4_2195 [Lactiplantibacillus plantarum]KZT92904.1 hypothetical protein Nizo2258_2576 [Lactiplantibacillus plantarum]KZT99957.1 hypothetical protein Nizo2257_0721 [Lactiplantibacillus plantarum]
MLIQMLFLLNTLNIFTTPFFMLRVVYINFEMKNMVKLI